MHTNAISLRILFFLSTLFALGSVLAESSSEGGASLQLSRTVVSMTVGESVNIAVSNSSGRVSATSGDRSVVSAAVAANVVTLKGLKPGSTEVTVKDRRVTRKVSVSVRPASSVGLTASPSYVAISAGTSATVNIANASGAVTALSSDALIATVTVSGATATIKAIKAGSASITLRDSKGAAVVQVSVLSTPVTTLGGYALLAWNDLGMHCVDGKDYSIFSILPPYNNLHAQLVNKATGKQVTSGVTLTYEAIPDDTVANSDPLFGSINTTSYTKTNFWDYVTKLFGASPPIDTGLNLSKEAGNRTPSLTPQPMSFAAANGWYQAEGIPITPVDDKGVKNFYPMVKVVAKDSAGNILATAKTVLPVSDEMTCKACHASNTSAAAKPGKGWVSDADAEKDWKKNILSLHDDGKLNMTLYQQALSTMSYNAGGLLATANSGQPVLCASCHSSNALGTTGVAGIKALTHALHGKHSTVKDPSGNVLGSVTNRTSCYMCHPGSETQCLRGAMSGPAQTCQNCHGNMKDVGNTARTGWLEQPNCQACHHDGKRERLGSTPTASRRCGPTRALRPIRIRQELVSACTALARGTAVCNANPATARRTPSIRAPTRRITR